MAIRHVAAAALLAVLLGGCGNDAVQGSPNGTGAPTTGTKKDDAPLSSRDPKQDVKVTSCKVSKHALSAAVEVTNRNNKTSEYYGQIYFLDPAGTRIAEGEFNSGNVEAGATKTKDVPAQNLTNAEKGTCEVGWIKLDNH